MRLSSPTPLQGPYGASWSNGVGATLDELFADYKDAIKARFPTLAAANNDSYALALLGTDSALPRYPGESLTDYGARLQARWQAYDRSGAAARLDGTGSDIYDDLVGLGFGDITIVEYRD